MPRNGHTRVAAIVEPMSPMHPGSNEFGCERRVFCCVVAVPENVLPGLTDWGSLQTRQTSSSRVLLSFGAGPCESLRPSARHQHSLPQ